MQTTPWRLFDDGSKRIRATYGLRIIGDNCYFSITGEIEHAHRGLWVNSSFGCLHSQIAALMPDLAPLIPFHLVDILGSPMHYKANATYWLEGSVFARNVEETAAQCIEYFKSTVLWGLFRSDINDSDIPTLKELDAWLAKRLPLIREKFHEMLKAIDMGTVPKY